jgi:translation initiation factor IF-2
MTETSKVRLNVALRELNISLDRAVEFLSYKKIEIEARPTAKISRDVYQLLLDEFETDKSKKDASHEISEEKKKEKESIRVLQEIKEKERLEQLQNARR